MPQGRTPPVISSLGSCKSIDEYFTALRGPCNWGDEAGVPTANGATSLVASCWPILAVVTSKSVCVCVVCVCVCVCGVCGV